MGKYLVTVEVGYLKGQTDPEGTTLSRSLHELGYDSVEDVRTARVYRICHIDARRPAQAKEIARKMVAKQGFFNPVRDYAKIQVRKA